MPDPSLSDPYRPARARRTRPTRAFAVITLVLAGLALVAWTLQDQVVHPAPAPPALEVGAVPSTAIVPSSATPSLESFPLDPEASISPESQQASASATAPIDMTPAPTITPQPTTTASPSAKTVTTTPVPAATTPVVTQDAPLDPVERWRREGIVLLLQGQTWDALSFTNVDKALSLLPAAVRDNLGDRDLGPLTILVNRSGRTSSGAQPYGKEANFFSTNEGRNELVLYPDQGVQTILHELGHAYNLRGVPAGSYALVLLDSEMESFMAATGWQVLTPASQIPQMRDQTQVAYAYTGATVWSRLSHNDPLEDYANSFAMYYADPAGLRQLSPARYDWFAAHLPR